MSYELCCVEESEFFLRADDTQGGWSVMLEMAGEALVASCCFLILKFVSSRWAAVRGVQTMRHRDFMNHRASEQFQAHCSQHVLTGACAQDTSEHSEKVSASRFISHEHGPMRPDERHSQSDVAVSETGSSRASAAKVGGAAPYEHNTRHLAQPVTPVSQQERSAASEGHLKLLLSEKGPSCIACKDHVDT